MKTKDLEIMSQLKINLDLDMLIILILKSMEFVILEVVVDSLQGRLQVELRLGLLQELY